MKNYFLLLFLLTSILGFSQVLNNDQSSTSVNKPDKYAVVIGISDYQDEGIPDLRFADKDAEAFANFLRSPAGGSLDEDHLKLLTNEMATSGELVAALDWLMEVSQEGDLSIIYFSGHGDVESKTRNQLGFLLTWNSPSKAYMAGAYPVFYLQNIIETISLDNKSKVLLVTDACRSGKLAGNAIGGSQLTSQNLATQYANEVKILSCQPDEYSIEGEQWGGGRGAFSYHLIDGLIGMADNNGDQAVSLMEISRYLEDHVTTEVAPQSQVPMTVGNRTEKLTDVMPDLLAQLQQGKKGQLDLFAPTDSKGMEDDILATVDTIVQERYQLFKQSLKDKNFLTALLGEIQEDCADTYFEQLIKEPKLERLHAAMRRNYAAALQDEAQQVLNKILNNDVEEMSLSRVSQTEKYRLYPGYLQRAAELVGEGHYMYPVLQARKLYFEGYLLHIDNRVPDRELGEKVLAKYRAALALQPDFPHPFYSMSTVQFWQMQQPDSAEYYATRAVELAPSWFVPYSNLAYQYMNNRGSEDLDKCKYFLELADRVDPSAPFSNIWHMYQWAGYYVMSAQPASSEVILIKIVQLDSSFAKAQFGLGTIYMKKGDFKSAEVQYKKTIALDSTNVQAATGLGYVYMAAQRHAEGEVYFKKAIRLNPADPKKYMDLSSLYNVWGRFEAADSLVKKAIQLDSTSVATYINAGQSYLSASRYDEAERLFLKGLQLDSNNFYLNFGLAQVYFMRGRYEKCEKILLNTLQQDSNNVIIRTMLGWIYFKNNQIEKAEEQMLEVLRIDSLNNEGLICLAILMGQTERYKQGEAIALKSVKLYPFDPHGPNTLGLIYAKSGRYAEAEQQLNKSLEMRPDDNNNAPSALLHYAVLYSLQNNIDKAFDYLEQVGQMEHLTPYFYIDLKAEPALAPLRAQTERWDALIKKYFPGQAKD